MKKHLKTFLKIAVSLLLVGFLIYTVDIDSVLKSVEKFNYLYGLIAILFVCLNYYFSSVRWKSLLSIYENTDHIGLPRLVSLYFVGSFFNNFMPTSIGGDAYKVYKLGKQIGSVENAFSATFMERFTGMVALVFISVFGLLGLFFVERSQLKGFDSAWLMIGILALLLLVLVLGFVLGIKIFDMLRKKISRFEKIYTSLIAYKGKNRILVLAFLTSFVVQMLSIFTQYFVFVGLGFNLDLFKILFLIPIITLASFFIPSLNGLGVQDVLYKMSYSFLAVSPELAITASIIYHFVGLSVSLLGGVLYAVDKNQ